MKTWANHLIQFYNSLQPPLLPNAIEWLHPQQQAETVQIMEQFFNKFFNDAHKRTLLLGINPGRFGAGTTGVNFTGPRQLLEYCGIEHSFKNRSELSAEFIYAVIKDYGGVQKFYTHFFIGSVCPLGFVQHGKNINYYDDRELLKTVEPFIIAQLQKLLSFKVNTQTCLCIGGEKNYKYLNGLNKKYGWFTQIVPLPHPRFIMQYRRGYIVNHIDEYKNALIKALP